MSEKYSPITFWSGVPVKHQRYVPFRAKHAFAVDVLRVCKEWLAVS